jgi:hypothetical protein
MQRDFQKAGDASGQALERGLGSQLPKVEKALDRATAASGKFLVEQEKLNAIIEKGGDNKQKLIQQSERVATAYRNESNAIRDVASAMDTVGDSARGSATSLEAMGTTVRNLSSAAGPVGIAVLAAGITQLAGVAAQASGAIGLLPGAVGGAAAAFGTLKLATLGFGDAMDSIEDPEKFAEALQKLSPAAQQAALQIQHLMPAFTQLKNATQDALFANVGPQLNAVVGQLMPTIQQATTGIAGAFNQMFMGVTNQLMTPETQANIQSFADNLVTAFNNLAPAVAPLTDAFSQLMTVGSEFLPDIATGASEAARSFAQFIREASASGELKEWIGSGLDIMKQLMPVTLDVAKAFLSLAPVGERVMPLIVRSVSVIADVMPTIATVGAKIGPLFASWSGALSVVETALKGIAKAVEMVGDGIAFIRGPEAAAQWQLTKAQMSASLDTSSGSGPRVLNPTRQWIPNVGWVGGPLKVPNAASMAGGGVGGAFNPGQSWQSTRGVGNTIGGSGSSGGSGGAGSDVKPYFDPSQWQVQPDLSKTAPGSDPSGVIAASEQLSEANLRLLELKSQENVQQSTLIGAQDNVLQAQRKLDEETRNTWNQMQKTAEKFTNGMDSLGAALDQDFGLSEGLPGLAKNLTMFFGNLIAAPELMKLQAISNINQQATGLQGGFGLLGQQGAQNMTQGLSPILGNPVPAAYTGASAMGPAAFGGGMGSDAALLSGVPAGSYSKPGSGAWDLAQGLGDCSSAVEDLVNIMDGRPTGGRSMATGNASEWLTQHGFMPGMGGPGDMRVGFNSSHMQATLPGGTPFNWGSNAAAARGGVGGTGAFDPAFTSHYFRPTGAGGSSGGSGGGGLAIPGLTDPANTNPALNNPAGGGGMMPGMGLPQGAPLGAPGVSGGMNFGGPSAPATSSVMPGKQPTANPAGQGPGLGGGAMDAAMMAAGGLDLIAPGAGQAAQTGMKLINRTIQFGGQLAAIGASGLMETFMLSGGIDPMKTLPGRLIGGFAGARPATPNQAGQTQQGQGPQAPGGTQQMGGGMGNGAPLMHVENMNVGSPNDGKKVADKATQQFAGAQAGGWFGSR